MRELGIDIETFSDYDLSECGVYRYVESPRFAVLLFGYCVDGGPVHCIDLACGEQIPDEIVKALQDPAVIKTAFNATFERVCLSRHLGIDGYLDPAQWRCTMVRAARMGFPLSLSACAEALRLEVQKMAEGRNLIRYFSCPGRKNERRLPIDAPDKWESFKQYNIKDVEVEQAILAKVRRLEPAPFDEELYIIDQNINDRGVLIDRKMVDSAAALDSAYRDDLIKQACELTGLENPNSAAQIKDYIRRTTGISLNTINKSVLDELEARLEFYPDQRRLIGIRRELGKTSNSKYAAMQACVCHDGRIHGLLQFYGAPRTGRWAGRLVQVQNLPQNHLEDIDYARELVRAGDLDDLSFNYADVSQTLSELIRTAFIASPGRTLHVCDFSAIEARVIAWLAGESWVLDVFRQGGDVYCAAASQMFNKPVEKHGANAHLRQKGKIATLALGYGGGVAALEAMGGKKLGLTPEEKKEIVRLWRRANKNIVRLWSSIEAAAVRAINNRSSYDIARGLSASFKWGALLLALPSGRSICYPRAAVVSNGDRTEIEYEGLNQTTKKWEKIRTYGGKLTENVVQAIARDILGMVLLRAHGKGLDVVFHVHDEIIVDAPVELPLSDVERLFSEPIDWCLDLPLKGAGYSTPYYLKD